MNVTVVDALMGTGKTEHAIRMLQRIASPYNESGQRFIYITPFLAEVDRVKGAVPESVDPKGNRKTEHLYELIGNGRNIVSTHKLFEYLDPRALGQLGLSDYVLVVDEVTDWVQPYTGMKLVDVKMLVDTGFITVNPATKRVMWHDMGGTEYDGKFANFRSLCLQGKIVATSVRADGVPAMILWTLPIEVLELFTETWVLTYLFEGSDMAAYLKLHDIQYKLMTLDEERNLVDHAEHYDAARVATRAGLITLTEDARLNAIGKKLKGEGVSNCIQI